VPATPAPPPPGLFARRPPVLLAILGASCISCSAVLIKLAQAGVASAAFYRCAFALPLLVPLAVAEQRRLGGRPLAGRAQTIVAGVLLAVDLVLWNHAIAAVGAGVATVLGNLQVLFVALAAWALFRERPGRVFLAALPVVMVGVVLVSGLAESGGGGTSPVAGIGYGMGTSIAYAAFLLVLRRASGRAPHVAGPLAEVTVGGTAGSLLLGLAFGGLGFALPAASLGWLALLAVTSQTAGWLLITSSLPRLPAAVSSLLLLLQPAAAMLLAAAVLGERPALSQLAGAVLICCGVLAVARSASSRPGPPYSGTERSSPAGLAPPAGGPAGAGSGPPRSSDPASTAPAAKMPADHQNAVA
jgi:drug/metabolite transporter (DMT)-like permease